MIIFSALVLVWFINNKNAKTPQELTIDLAITRINNKDFKEALFKQSQVEFTDANSAKWITTIGSDPTRESLLKVVNDFNTQNPSGTIKTSEESSFDRLWLAGYYPASALCSADRIPGVYPAADAGRRKQGP